MARAVSVVLVLIVALTATAAEQGPPRYGGTLRIAIDGTIASMDPFKGTRFRQNFSVQRFYTDGLVDLDAQANVVPALAESWEISPDGRVYSFKLRRGVKFQDRKSTRLNSSHIQKSRMPSSA